MPTNTWNPLSQPYNIMDIDCKITRTRHSAAVALKFHVETGISESRRLYVIHGENDKVGDGQSHLILREEFERRAVTILKMD